MDTTKEYIKMCRKAFEIQELWGPKSGDFYIIGGGIPGDKHFSIIYLYLGCCWKKCEGCKTEVKMLRHECTWLPRQDQSHGMIDWSKYRVSIEKFGSRYKMVCKDLTKNFWEENLFYCDSMEQLWLAFVMHEKYNKKWNGEDWVKP